MITLSIGEVVEGTNLTFLKLTGKKATPGDNPRQYGLFKCVCGVEKELMIKSVRAKGTKSCGCQRYPTAQFSKLWVDYSGQYVNGLKCLKRIDKKIGVSTAIYKFQCSYCINTFEAPIGHITRDGLKSCGCVSNRIGKDHPTFKGYGEISLTYFHSLRNDAKRRNIKEFLVSIEYIWNLFLKQNRKCKFTGEILQFKSRDNAKDGTASLDRIDSTKGYNVDNVQWVRKDVNIAKRNKTDEQFIAMCRDVANHNPSPPPLGI